MKLSRLSPFHQCFKKAFTLLEMMIVLAIIGLIMGATLMIMGVGLGGAEVQAAQMQVNTLHANVTSYKTLGGLYPTTEQGLKALVTKPVNKPMPRRWAQSLKELPLDPWQREYLYRYPGVKNPTSFDVYSAGLDGVPDTDDDIGNW